MNNLPYKFSEIHMQEISVDDITMLYVKTTDIQSDTNIGIYVRPNVPVSLFTYNDEIYFGIYDYSFSLFSGFEDWNDFSSFSPSEKEFIKLSEYNPVYYKLDYEETLKGNLDEFSEFELDILKSTNRDIKLKKLLP